jgi:hypothetical protein
MKDINERTPPADAAQLFLNSDVAQGVLRRDVQCHAIQGFYIVVYGYAPGIYTMWYVPYDFRSSSIVLISYICREDCHSAGTGYKNAKFKKLTTFAEAMAWMILKGQKLGQEEPVGAVRSAVLGTLWASACLSS